MIVRDLLTKWGFRVEDGDVKAAERRFKKFQTTLRNTAKSATALGGKLSTRLSLPIIALGGFAIKAASDAEETLAKFGTVFQDVRGEADKTAKNLSRNFGLSSVKAQELLGDTGDLLTGFGFTGDMALDLSSKVNELAVDLASFTNFSGGAEGASKALTKALLGERESIKTLGISILEEDVQARVKQLEAMGQFRDETERQKKAFATLLLAQEQSKNAIGDFARTSEGFANQVRILKGRLFDLAVSFGQIVLPVANKLVGVIKDGVEFFDGLSKGMKTTIVVVAGLAAALGPLILIFAGILNTIVLTTVAMQFLGKASIIAWLKMLAPILLVAAALAGIILVFEDIASFFKGEKSITGLIVNEFNKAIDFINTKFMELPDIVKSAIAIATVPIRSFINLIQGIGGFLGTLVGGGSFDSAMSALGESVKSSLTDVDFNDVGALIGFGAKERSFRASTPATAGAGASSGGNNVSVNVSAPVSVPPGTPPELVGTAIKDGIRESMDISLRQASQATASEVEF